MLAGNSSTCTRQNGDDERVGCQSGKQGWRQIARTDLVHKTLRPHRAHFRFITHLPLLLWCTGSVRNISSWTGTIDLANRGARRPIGLRLLEPCSGDLINRSPWDDGEPSYTVPGYDVARGQQRSKNPKPRSPRVHVPKSVSLAPSCLSFPVRINKLKPKSYTSQRVMRL